MAKALLSDSDSESTDNEVGGTEVTTDLKVNQEYAKRFEHNKKREELARLEDKLGKPSRKRKRDTNGQSATDSESSSSSEDEDEDGELATAALDNEIMATLTAIKSKDPRVYDAESTFYTETDNFAQAAKEKTAKPLYLKDYHRENLLNGARTDNDEKPLSYNQEQEQLKKSVVKEMHAAAGSDSSDSDEEGGLLVRKEKPEETHEPSAAIDIDNADRDPETFLSDFMAARAWIPTDRAELHPFESDDEEDEKRAEEFEEAYNMRFEDPEKSNETLRSHARDVAAKHSVRRDEKNSRRKKRDAEKAAKDAAKQQIKEDKARLKKLRMEEVEEKVRRIKRAAGLRTSDLMPSDWAHFIDDDWDDSRWEQEMQTRFGDQYYAEEDQLSSAGSEDGENNVTSKRRKKPKKPKFEDDIDIKDIIPDFEDDDEKAAADFSLSEDEDADVEAQSSKLSKSSKSKKQARIDRQKETKRERRIIEQLVDDQLQLDLDNALPASSRAKSAGFRYRETSPQAFGLTSREILLADDSALNQFAGLKKLASWRDEEKKRKDRKHLGKKARLRKWRSETFGDEDGPKMDIDGENYIGDIKEDNDRDQDMGGVNIREGDGKKKKKGRRRKKARIDEGVALET